MFGRVTGKSDGYRQDVARESVVLTYPFIHCRIEPSCLSTVSRAKRARVINILARGTSSTNTINFAAEHQFILNPNLIEESLVPGLVEQAGPSTPEAAFLARDLLSFGQKITSDVQVIRRELQGDRYLFSHVRQTGISATGADAHYAFRMEMFESYSEHQFILNPNLIEESLVPGLAEQAGPYDPRGYVPRARFAFLARRLQATYR
ncbi:hypothetical protein CEXT_540571 [Caerostris extrusa]|uniref:Uncharacterized protein n=1 Tax=Caerostris extrusa TaxID=172846 RepID=A0AAV4NBX6_CAEEX|nr:hypothetical protein CEXT_540571 [Caerostris extrusa]